MALVQDWEARGLLFSLLHEGIRLYPAYGLDFQAGVPPAGLRVGLEELRRAGRSNWGVAFWFHGLNSHLGGRPPKDCLKGPLEALQLAAKREAEGILHG